MNVTFTSATEFYNLANSSNVWSNETFSDHESYDPENCSSCLNELCIPEADYIVYRSWVSVDTFEMVLIALNIIVFLAGIIGNSLVSSCFLYFWITSRLKIRLCRHIWIDYYDFKVFTCV